MAALAAFVPHADFSQDSCRRKVVREMARENARGNAAVSPVTYI